MKRFLIAIVTTMLALTAILTAGCAGASKKKGAGMVTLETWLFTSGVPNNLITVTDKREDAVYVCTTEKGDFWSRAEGGYCKQVTLSAGETTSWQPIRSAEEIEFDFVDIIVKENDEVVGYAVIKITERERMDHEAKVLKARYFLAPVTQEFVEGIIKNIKDKNS